MIFELKQSNEGKPVEITIMTRSKVFFNNFLGVGGVGWSRVASLIFIIENFNNLYVITTN